MEESVYIYMWNIYFHALVIMFHLQLLAVGKEEGPEGEREGGKGRVSHLKGGFPAESCVPKYGARLNG